MPIHAVDEHELANRPEDRLDRLLLHFALVIEQRDVRVEIRTHQVLQAVSHHRVAKHLPKLLQPAQSFIAKQHERMIVRSAAKASYAVEPNIKRWHAHLLCGLVCLSNDPLTRAASVTEKKQRNVKTICSDERAIELMSALDDFRHAVDAGGRSGTRLGTEK